MNPRVFFAAILACCACNATRPAPGELSLRVAGFVKSSGIT